ncbi:hypothetical protein QTN25_002700 [Entamoeba marina]
MDKLLTSDTFQKFCTFLHEVDDILSSINTENKVVEPKETQSKSYKSHNFQHFMSHGDKEQQTTDLTSVLLTLKHVVTSLEMLINEKTTETKLQKQSTQTTTSKKEHNQQSGSKHSDTKKKGGFGLFKKSDKVPKQLSQRSILKGVEKHLKEWSGKQISGIVFDSDLDGDDYNITQQPPSESLSHGLESLYSGLKGSTLFFVKLTKSAHASLTFIRFFERS